MKQLLRNEDVLALSGLVEGQQNQVQQFQLQGVTLTLTGDQLQIHSKPGSKDGFIINVQGPALSTLQKRMQPLQAGQQGSQSYQTAPMSQPIGDMTSNLLQRFGMPSPDPNAASFIQQAGNVAGGAIKGIMGQ